MTEHIPPVLLEVPSDAHLQSTVDSGAICYTYRIIPQICFKSYPSQKIFCCIFNRQTQKQKYTILWHGKNAHKKWPLGWWR